jgi:hypothetical protein
MGGSGKSLLALVMIIGMIGSVFAWMTDGATWRPKAAFPAIALGAFAILLWQLLRKDKVPDLLRKTCGNYFERDGFCFMIAPAAFKGEGRLDVYFQNRFERPCRAQVAIRPSQQFFLNRRPIEMLTIEIECEGGAFGVAHVPWAVPAKLQGKKQSFDVGAHTEYPSGRGAMIRYRDGLRVGTAKRDVWSGILTMSGAVGGVVVLAQPAKIKLVLPKGIAETVAEDAPISIETLWRPGGDDKNKKLPGKKGAAATSPPGVWDQEPRPA